MNERHCLTLHNDRAELARMMAWIDDLMMCLRLSPRTGYALRLCLEEAITNVILYAFEVGTVHDLHIAAWRDDTVLFAQITDDGQPFDPLSHELPAAPKDLQSAPIGGLGIKLMRSFAERITYQRCGTVNRLTLSFPAEV